jgi:hypothetical protein
LIQAWFGVRTGFERLTGEFRYELDSAPAIAPGSAEPASPVHHVEVTASRWYAGGLLGLAIGVHPLRVVMELDGAFQHLNGELRGPSERSKLGLSGFTLAPAGALVGEF